MNCFRESLAAMDGSYVSYRIVSTNRLHIDELWKGNFKSTERVLADLIRQVVQRALRENLSISAGVMFDSMNHLFFLKMGMVPDDFSYSYAAWNYGEEGYRALAAVKEEKTALRHWKILKEIIKKEGRPKGGSPLAVLKEVLERKYSFLRDRFFPRFLSLLASKEGRSEFPDCSHLGSMNMQLSARGLRRWENAIQDELPFVPFSRFEHLKPLMTEEQQNLLGYTNTSTNW